MPKVLKAKMFGMNIWNFGDGQLFVNFQLFVYFSQMSHLGASKAETAQSKDVQNENLEFEMISCLFTFSCLFTISNKPLRDF